VESRLARILDFLHVTLDRAELLRGNEHEPARLCPPPPWGRAVRRRKAASKDEAASARSALAESSFETPALRAPQDEVGYVDPVALGNLR
jgi:hypothetical protein